MVVAQKSIEAGVLKNSTNDTYGSNYANLGSVITAIKEHLNNAGIVVMQSPTISEQMGNICLTTRFLHVTGEWLEDTCSAPLVHMDPQGFGSAVSYLRRYALSAMMCLYQADDDGAKSSEGRDFMAAPTNSTVSVSGTPAAAAPARSPVATPAAAPINEATEKRLKSWLNTISMASLERLEASRSIAKTTFSGLALETVEKAFEERIATLRSVAV
jgi:hypothetical protein